MDFQTDLIDPVFVTASASTLDPPQRCRPLTQLPMQRIRSIRVYRVIARHLLCLLLVVSVILQTLSPRVLLAQSDTPTPSEPQSTDATDSTTQDPEDSVELNPLFEERQMLDAQVELYLSQMTDAEKVGQLFMITFEGDDVGAESPIAELIRDYHVGGIVLSPKKKNFVNEKNSETPRKVATLINQLQALSYGLLLPERQALDAEFIPRLDYPDIDPALLDTLLLPPAVVSGTVEVSDATIITATETTSTTAIITDQEALPSLHLPLLVAVEQLGDNLPGTALREGFTELPTQMAIGATWNPEIARAVGEIVGRELHAVGVNMLFGPSLDVLSQPRVDAVGRLGVHSFGGNPYWVGQMGKAYITGVHSGAEGRVLAIARHFPGQGDSDRFPDQEVATIQTNGQELLRSFIPVMQVSPALPEEGQELSTADGIMSSHMHFSNIQEGVAENTTPLSQDVDTLHTLLAQEQFANWRENGLLVSNALGALAIRRFYDPAQEQFLHNRIALDTLNAGHDLLYLGDFSLDDTWDSERQNIVETILFFRTRYQEDVGTKAKVDDAVRRIIRAKLRMYSDKNALDEVQSELSGEAAEVISGTENITATEPVTGASELTTSSSISTTEQTTSTIQEQTGLGTDVNRTEQALSLLSQREEIPLSSILVSELDLVVLGEEMQAAANDVINTVALESLTILHPEDPNQLPDAPNDNDKIIIFTDSRLQFECEGCTVEAAVGPDVLGQIMESLYGLDATAQLTNNQIESRTFAQLSDLLDAQELLASESEGAEQPSITASDPISETEETLPEVDALDDEPTTSTDANEEATDANSSNTDAQETVETPEPLAETEAPKPLGANEKLAQQIEESTWIIFVMLDVDTDSAPDSNVVKRFLSQNNVNFSGKKVAVVGLGGPYYLDATEVSQLSFYVGVYSKIEPFVRTAVLALFKAFAPQGAPPISVPGTQFNDLTQRLQPDPQRPLNIEVMLDGVTISPVDDEAEAENETLLQVGQTIRVQIGQILDQNGKQVPDGTAVDLALIYEGEESARFVVPVLTRNGFANYNAKLEQGGTLLISAQSGEGEAIVQSQQLSIAVEGGLAEAAPESTATVIANNSISETVDAATGETNASQPSPLASQRVDIATLMIALLTILITLSLLLIVQVRVMPRDELIRHLLWATIVGLLAYILYGVGVLPGADWLQLRAYPWGTAIIVFIGMLLPVLWLQLRTE